MSRRDPTRGRGRPSISKPSSQNSHLPSTPTSQPPSLVSPAEQQWSAHNRSSLGCSPQLSRNSMLSSADPGEARSTFSKPSTPLTNNQPLPERTPTAHAHSFRSENQHLAGPNDPQHPRSPAVYYNSYPAHRQPSHAHPQQQQPHHHHHHHHHQAVYPPPVPHDHRPELHLRTNLSQQPIRHSSLSTPDGHSLSAHSSSRPDLDSQHSYRPPHHQSPIYEQQFLHPSQRTHHSDPSRPSPSTSTHPLPYQASRPSTSSSHTHQHLPLAGVGSSQQIRHSHHIDSLSASPDRPRLYQPEPRRVNLSSPDLQLQISPRHQNADLYPSQANTERLSQQAISSTPTHPLRSSHSQTHQSAHPPEDAHFSSPRQFDRYPEQPHPSVQGPPRHRSSRSTDFSHHLQPPRQPGPQPVYMHELSPRFQHPHGHSLYPESSSHRNENTVRDRSHQPSSHDIEQSPRSRFPTDRLASDPARFAQPLPENISAQHATHMRREHPAGPMAMQIQSSSSNPSQRQQTQTHHDHIQQFGPGQQRQTTQIEPVYNKSLNPTDLGPEQSPDGRIRLGSSHAAPLDHRDQARSNGSLLHQDYPIDPPQELHPQKKKSLATTNTKQNSRLSKTEKLDELSRTANRQLWTQNVGQPSGSGPSYAAISNDPSSSKQGGSREKPYKSSPKSILLERPRSKGASNVETSQFGQMTADSKKPKFPPFRRPSSPSSKYPLLGHGKRKEGADDFLPESSRPKYAHGAANSNPDCDTSREPSSSGDGAVDEVADDGVIRCICSITTDDGFTIQCETCEVWQHAVCVNVPIDEVPEHYFCDRCDPSPERRRRLAEMAPQAERTQRQRLKKEADTRSQDQPADENSIAPGSPNLSNQPDADEPYESLVDSPAASTAMSRVSSGVCVNESTQGEPTGQSPNSHAKGKSKATPMGHHVKLPASSYPDNGLGLCGLQESPMPPSAPRTEDSHIPLPRKPGRKPTKFAQPKPHSSKQPLDPPLSCSTASNILESDNNLPSQNGAEADDRYEAWRYEYTPTLKDIYTDADVKCQVQQLIAQYTRIRSLCKDDFPIGSDTEVSPQEVGLAERAILPPPSKPLSTSTERSPVQAFDHLAQVSDTPAKSQRPVPHGFANTQFLPVTMSELPPPSKLTIKPIAPSTINFFPSLATNPFCPTFSNSLNNSSTSSLPRLITHGVFSTQPIPRGSYIASLKGSITSFRHYTGDVYNQYTSLGCNKPYVKFFKSTKLEDRFLQDQDFAQIADGLVIDSRQYGNEMRFIRNGCHPNAFINIIMTPQASRSQDAEPSDGPDLTRSGTPSSRTCSFTTPGSDRHHHTNNLWSTSDPNQPLPWEVSFGIFAASDITRREEIILPWEWDDQHLVHLLPRLLSHSSTFEAQQQKSPTLPTVRIQFLPWSMSDLKLLSCKLAAVTLTLFGLMFCGCERKKSCAVNLMWKIGCLSAGQPMFPTQQTGSSDSEACELTPISSLKERQEMNLSLTFEESFRLVLNSFLEQPNHLPSKIGRNANANANPPTTSRQKKHKIDLGPMLGLKRDWWLCPRVQNTHADPSRTDKTITKSQKRQRSRSVFNHPPSVHKIRRVSDAGGLRQPGLISADPTDETQVPLLEAEPSQAPTVNQPTLARVQQQVTRVDKTNAISIHSVEPQQHETSLPSPPILQDLPRASPRHEASVMKSPLSLPATIQDAPNNLPMPCNTADLQQSDDVILNDQPNEDCSDAAERSMVPEVNEPHRSESSSPGDREASDAITGTPKVGEAKIDTNSPADLASNETEHVMSLVPGNRGEENIVSDSNVDALQQPQKQAETDEPPALHAEYSPEELNRASSAPEEGEVDEEEIYPEEESQHQPTHVSPPGPTPGYRFPKPPPDTCQPEPHSSNTSSPQPVLVEPINAEDEGHGIDDDAESAVEPVAVEPVNQPVAQVGSQNEPANQASPGRRSLDEHLEPSPPGLDLVGQHDDKMVLDQIVAATQLINDSCAQDSARFGPQQNDIDDPPATLLDRNHDETHTVTISHCTPPPEFATLSDLQDSTQVVPVADPNPEPMVTSPKNTDAQDSSSSPGINCSNQQKPDQNHDVQYVVEAEIVPKSPGQVHDGSVSDNIEASRMENNEQHEASTTQTQLVDPIVDQVKNALHVTEQLVSSKESQPLILPFEEGIRQSPQSLLSPSLDPTKEQTPADSSSKLSRRSMSTASETRSDGQADESALSQPSEGSEERLLDSDASTTILGSSDEEMLSSHTPRYLNNRKRIRSKNIIKLPPRIAAVKKPSALQIDRSSGLATSGTARLNKPELRANGRLKPPPVGYQKGNSSKASSLSDLDSEDEVRGNSTDPVVKESGSKMRLTIRSSSPSDNDDDDLNDKVAGKQQRNSKASPIPSLSSAPDPPPNFLGIVKAPVAGKLGRLGLVHATTPSATISSNSQLVETIINLDRAKSDADIPNHPNPSASNATPQPIDVKTTPSVLNRAVDTPSTEKCPLVVNERQESAGIQAADQGSSTLHESPVVTQSPDVISNQFGASRSAPGVNSVAGHPKKTSVVTAAEISGPQSKKAAPKRISLKDYRSRKVSEPVVVTPLANPLIHFATNRPTSTPSAEEGQKKQPPPPIIPVLPPLLPPTSQSQPLLPLSPRKLELVASVLKKEEKDRARSSKDGETEPKSKEHDGSEILTLVPHLPTSPTGPAPDEISKDPDALVHVVELKKPVNRTPSGSVGKPSGTNMALLSPELQQTKTSPQPAQEVTVGAYEDDIDGVAIESMSNPSEDELEDAERHQESPSNEHQPQNKILAQEQQETLVHGKRPVPGEEQHAMLDKPQEEMSDEVMHEVLGERPQVLDEEQIPEAQNLPTGEAGIRDTPGQASDFIKQQVKHLRGDEPQQTGLESPRTANAIEETKPPFVDVAGTTSMRDANVTSPAANDQMEVDEAYSSPDSNNASWDGPPPPRVAGRATHDNGNTTDDLPAIKSEHTERAMSIGMTIQTMQPDDMEVDMEISPIVAQQPAAPKPRLSIADYRRRKVARPSVSEEPHPSQSMSPSLPDLELSRINQQPSQASPETVQQIPSNTAQQNQQEAENLHSATSLDNAADEARHSHSPSPCRSDPLRLTSQPSEHKPNINNVEVTDVSMTLKAPSDLRLTDTTMYFPPISPSILMAMESPRSPELKYSPSLPGSPSEEKSPGRDTHVATPCSPPDKSPSRTPLETTPVASTSSLKGDSKPSSSNQSSILPRPVVNSVKSQGCEPRDDRPLRRKTPPAPKCLSTQSPPRQLSSEKSTFTATSSGQVNVPQYTRFEIPKSSTSVHVSSLPSMASHSLLNQHRKPAPVSSLGSQPTPIIGFNSTNPRVQLPPEATFPGVHGNQIVPHVPSSRLIPSSSSSQRSPTHPSSALVYKHGISSSSPAPTALSDLRPSPRGPSTILPGLNRGPPSRPPRAPPIPNTSRASWPPEPVGPGPIDPQYSGQGPPSGVHFPPPTKTFSDMPSNPSLPPPPSHATGPPRNPSYHYPHSHRGGGFAPMRNFSGHRATTTPIMGTSGPGPPGPFRPPPQTNHEGIERARYDGFNRGPIPGHPSSYPVRGRAKVRGVGQPTSSSSYWPIEHHNPSGAGGGGTSSNSSNSSSGAGRGFGGPPRNDR
ncbi:hypothetical protein MJO28_000537 [Puccinia striiformis f. sp. tritici]|uniref:Uncharacterized protein n=1 Tax=Puccinia striiformis f. sp. tritici TaxID=168172 RepID=A0ACC0EXP8_9BASI|nr:hypothetical protein MJO28_000537 [Puccinia striiformis f. sp. tritici]